MYMEKNHAKNFVLQFGSLIALYVSITALLILLFGVINLRYPDEAAGIYEDESARESIRMSIAMLIVVFPAFIALTRISHQNRRKDPLGEYTTIAKWLVYMSLLVAGAAMLADLVTLILYFLNGEITIRFVLKVFVFFAILSSAFTYYLFDIKGKFLEQSKLSVQIGAVTTLVVAISVIGGFMYIETPQEVREIKLDEQQVADLQQIQYRIEEYYRVRDGFPESIDDLYAGERMPTAPEGRPEYRYILTGENSYQLCATFTHESQDLGRYPTPVFPMEQNNYSWDHNEGEKCFDRVISEIKVLQ